MDKRVMIIDAHPVYAPKINAFLEGLTFKNIEIVDKSKDVFDRVRIFKPDVIILSAMLPDIDSVDILKLIRTQLPFVSVIVQTGLLTDAGRCLALKEAGASSVIPRLEKDLIPLQKAIEAVI